MAVQPLKFSLFLLTVGTLTGFGQHAQASALVTEPANNSVAESGEQLQAQAIRLCEYGGYPTAFVQIATSGDPLRVRLGPDGEQIGLIPNGWEVRVLEWSRNGYWVKVTSQYGSWTPGPGGFASAPSFAEGWVSAGYVKNLARSCQKPSIAAQLLRPDVFGTRPVEVQGDWLAMGDMLAESVAD